MRTKLNNKGFTLIELLAVLVILIAIMSIAIPNISSALERNKKKQTKSKIELIQSAAELYVTDNKNDISPNTCISIETLIEKGYLDDDDDLKGSIVYKKLETGEETYTYQNKKCS